MEGITSRHASFPAHLFQCSTPFGIMEGITVRPHLDGRDKVCAQRLSASWKESPNTVSPPSSPYRSAQRLSASWKESRAVPGHVLVDVIVVLNAFRHHGRNHSEFIISASASAQCSTPFGIMEGITISHVFQKFVLSACSTPFGIMEGITEIVNQCTTMAELCSTPFGIMEGITEYALATQRENESAQRLSASWKESRGTFPQTVGGHRCSTPFGIMEGITCSKRIQRRALLVLNAFRHHGRNHPSGSRCSLCCRPVLNAFRHHGRNHSAVLRWPPRHSMCSTPFGIMEGITNMAPQYAQYPGCAQRLSASWKESRRRSFCPAPRILVLNAFRHHGRNHRCVIEAAELGLACSTPFGIMEGIT